METWSLMAFCVYSFINVGNSELDARAKNMHSLFNKLPNLSELLHQDVCIYKMS